MHTKINAKIDTIKVKKKYEKWTKNGAKIDPKIDKNSSFLRKGVFAKMLFLA